MKRSPTAPGSPLPARLLSALLVAVALPLSASASAGQRDHDRARQAVQAGEVLPLARILARLNEQVPGQALEVELERRSDRWVYEIKQLTADGVIEKIRVDAASGDIIERRVRHRSR